MIGGPIQQLQAPNESVHGYFGGQSEVVQGGADNRATQTHGQILAEQHEPILDLLLKYFVGS